MQGIWLENNSIIIKDNIQMPEPLEGEALVRVRLAGICATDLELVNGYYPYTGILGHEFVGEIVPANNAIPMVEVDKCTACGDCVAACPRNLVVQLVPFNGWKETSLKRKKYPKLGGL